MIERRADRRWLLLAMLVIATSAAFGADWRERFTDPEDGSFDASEYVLDHEGVLPVPIIITEPAVGYGGTARSKDELFSLFGPDAAIARGLYDPRGDQSLDELKQQVFADRTLVEPARHFANEFARAGQPVWLYRFAYVSEAHRGQNMGTLHGFEIPFTFNIPAAMVREQMTSTDKAMGEIASGYWVQFAKSGDPNGGDPTGGDRPNWPRHDPAIDRLLHFTNSGVIVGTDPLKSRLDLWQRVWSRAQ